MRTTSRRGKRPERWRNAIGARGFNRSDGRFGEEVQVRGSGRCDDGDVRKKEKNEVFWYKTIFHGFVFHRFNVKHV